MGGHWGHSFHWGRSLYPRRTAPAHPEPPLQHTATLTTGGSGGKEAVYVLILKLCL